MPYSLEITGRARKALRKLDPTTRRRIAEAIDALTEDPRPPGCEKITASPIPHLYRIRAGAYRVIYRVDEGRLLILIVLVAGRKEIYELLKRLRDA